MHPVEMSENLARMHNFLIHVGHVQGIRKRAYVPHSTQRNHHCVTSNVITLMLKIPGQEEEHGSTWGSLLLVVNFLLIGTPTIARTAYTRTKRWNKSRSRARDESLRTWTMLTHHSPAENLVSDSFSNADAGSIENPIHLLGTGGRSGLSRRTGGRDGEHTPP